MSLSHFILQPQSPYWKLMCGMERLPVNSSDLLELRLLVFQLLFQLLLAQAQMFQTLLQLSLLLCFLLVLLLEPLLGLGRVLPQFADLIVTVLYGLSSRKVEDGCIHICTFLLFSF